MMKYVKNLFINEMATLGVGIIVTVIAAIAACMIAGINDYDAACHMGYAVGIICGMLFKVIMMIVFVVTIVKTSKTV